MTARRSAQVDRIVRLELLRARAAIERESLRSRGAQLADSLDPRLWLGKIGSSRSGGVLLQGLDLAQRYPFILSALTSLVLGKRWQWLKLGGAALAALIARLTSTSRSQPANTGQDR